jgi:hypothetical protein
MDLIAYRQDAEALKFVKIAPILGNYTYSCSTGLSNLSSNDFELKMPYSVGDKLFEKNQCISWGNTEFGGFIKNREIDTDKGQVIYRGLSWRGLWAHNYKGAATTEVTGDVNVHFNEFISHIPEVAEYVEIRSDIEGEIANIYNPMISLLNGFDEACIVFDATFGIGISGGKIIFYIKPAKTHRFDASQTKVIFEENWQRVNAVIAVNEELGIEATAYLQANGTVGTEQYYKGFDSISKVITASATTADELYKQAKAELEKNQELIATDVFVDIETSEVGDMVTASIAEIGLKTQKRVVEKTIKVVNGNATITYTLEG